MKQLLFICLLMICLLGCRKPSWPSAISIEEARAIMDDVSRRNLAYEPLTEHDDTMMLRVVAYYRKHGTNNDLMEAYYLLGSVYRDLHEAPKAMEAFLNGINAADTTSADCRYDLLTRLYAQKSDIMYRQNLYQQAAEAENMVYRYASLAKDTLFMVSSLWGRLDRCFASCDYQTIADECWDVLEESKRMGMYSYGATWLCTSILANVELGRLEDAAKLLSIYEQISGKIDPVTHESSFPIYYYAKGRVLAATGLLDSAEYFYRKELEAQDWNNRQAAYRGLRMLFEQKGQKDSICKYAPLQCDAVDSSYQEKLSQNLQNLQELYDYSRAQKDSHEKRQQLEKEQRTSRRMWWGIVIALFGAVMTFYHLRVRYRKKIADAELELERANTEQTELMLYVAELQEKLKQSNNEQEREEIKQELNSARKEYDNSRLLAKNLRQQYFPCPIFRKMLQIIKDGRIPSEKDYAMIVTTLLKHDESLMARFDATAPMATDIEKKIFLLRRMGMTKSEISLLTARAKNSIISAIERFYEKAHFKKPLCSAEADEWLLQL